MLATISLFVSCDPPKSSPPPKLSFRQSAVVKSRAHRTYTNELLVNGKPATGNVSYRITDPADFASKNIKIDENTGKLTFQEPVKVTVEAKHTKGSSATYTLTVTDHFSGRSSFTAVAIGSDIYFIGGNDGRGRRLNDVWKSTDGGVFWNKENMGTTSTLFSVRSRHSSVSVDSDIYIIGGFDGTNRLNDVWKSTDGGATWSEVTTGTTAANTLFSGRNDHSSVVVDSGPNAGIYVIGGTNGTNLFNEVWKSTDDGATWSQVATGIRFSARTVHSSVSVGSDIYVIGGFTGSRSDEVWKSTDGGQNWSQVATGKKFSARANHNSVAVGTDIYVIGGSTGSRSDEVWKSTDGGQNWNQVATGTRFSARILHRLVVIGSDIYVIGGDDGTNILNDVWKSTDGGVTWKNVHE